MLSGLPRASDLAALPAAIDAEDFHLWHAACLLGREPSTEELATVIRVADALGDSRLSEWTDLLGVRAHATDWQQPDQADAMTYTLLSLPSHLLHAALMSAQACANDCTMQLIGLFPPRLHAAILAAASPSTLSLTWRHLKPDHISILADLSSTKFAPPGLLSLKVRLENILGPSRHSGIGHTSALAAVLAAHPSLTALHVNSDGCPYLTPRWLINLNACLPPTALPSLRTLALAVHAHPCTCAALTRVLQRLPILQSLNISVLQGQQRELRQLQQFPAGGLSRSDARPVCLRCLTQLKLQEVHSNYFRGQPGALDPTVTLQRILRLLQAPALISLSLVTRRCKLLMESICSAMRHLTTLQEFKADLFLLLPQHLRRAGPCAAQAVLPPGLPPSVQAIEMSRDLPQAHPGPAFYTVALMFMAEAAPSSLTRLCTVKPCSCQQPVMPAQEKLTNATWIRAMAAIGRLNSLQCLRLHLLCAGLGRNAGLALCCSLARLTALTELSLQCECETQAPEEAFVLPADHFANAVQRLGSLQRLRLSEGNSWALFDAPLQAVDACSVLCALSRLMFLCQVDHELLPAVLQKLPALKRLWLTGRTDALSASRRAKLARQFPGVSAVQNAADSNLQFSDCEDDEGDALASE